jgi:hypothetical protein
MNIEFVDTYLTQLIIVQELHNELFQLGKIMMTEASETIDILSHLGLSDDDKLYILAVSAKGIRISEELVPICSEIEDYLHENETEIECSDFCIVVKSLTEGTRNIRSKIQIIKYIHSSYIDGLDYDSLNEMDTLRRYFSSPDHNYYTDISIVNDSIVISNKNISNKLVYDLDIPKIRLSDELPDDEISIPKSLALMGIKLFRTVSNDFYLSPPLQKGIFDFCTKYYFHKKVVKNKKYMKYVINTYSDILMSCIKSKDMNKFQENNMILLGLCNVIEYPDLYEKIHKKVRHDLT